MPATPSAAVRFAVEAAFVILVALGAALTGLEPVVIVGLTAVSLAVVAVVERVYARRTPSASVPEPRESHRPTEDAEAPKDEQPPEPEPEAQPQPEPAVSERAARAILATGPPPVVEPARARPEPEPEAEEAEPEPVAEHEPSADFEQPEPEPVQEPVAGGLSREWSIWDLERIARDHPEDPRQQEWAALILSLREFARADGMLGVDFDPLVRESFGALLVAEPTAPETAAAP